MISRDVSVTADEGRMRESAGAGQQLFRGRPLREGCHHTPVRKSVNT